jgi:hypothetical protein
MAIFFILFVFWLLLVVCLFADAKIARREGLWKYFEWVNLPLGSG